MIPRRLSETLRRSPKSILILGPRQVGKSTLIESLKPDLTVNLSLQREFLSFSSNPGELEERIAQTKPRTVLVDEIQRIPDLLHTIQALIDSSRGKLKFYLSGSSARKLRRGNANLLPGRILTYRMGPLSALELDYELDSKRALEVGTLPEVYSGDPMVSEKLLKSYTATYLHEEILAESLVRQVQGFSRFLGVAAEHSGKFLDFSKLASRSKVNRSSARRYFDILEDTLIAEKVDSHLSDRADLVRHPKYYFFDVGVVNGLLGNFRASPDRSGLLFEHLFFNQLKNTSYCLDQEIEVTHFRTRGGLEVDFLVKINGRLSAVEVKSSEPSTQDLKPLLELQEYLPTLKQKFVACLSCTPRNVKGIQVLPWQQVLAKLFSKN